MIQNFNNNMTVLPFYNSRSMQNHRKSYAYGQVYPLYAQTNMLMPFQIIRNYQPGGSHIFAVSIINLKTNERKGITTEMLDSGLQAIDYKDLGYTVFTFPGNIAMNLNLKEGQYYLYIVVGEASYYSEVMTLVDDTSGLLKIEWFDEEDLMFEGGRIVYKNPSFRNTLYLCTELGKPDYEFQEEGSERDGYFFPEKQVSEKTYKFVALAPEYLCDAMRLIRMSDHILVTDKYGHTYDCDSFLMSPKWQEQGDLASVDCEFQTNTVVKKLGKGYILARKGDFNYDFNNDYLRD